MECYEIDVINNKESIFDFVDCTYVLTMYNSKRREQFLAQLDKYKLTKKIKIINNKGFKNCPKQLCTQDSCTPIDSPARDLIHANKFALEDAIKNGYDNIMILEDDFIISEKINEKQIINDIKNLLNIEKNNNLLFYLGCLPWYSNRYYDNFREIISSTGTQGLIYNRKAINYFNKHINSYKDLDFDIQTTSDCKLVTYNQPLIYQIFEETENQKAWGNDYGIIGNIVGKFIICIIKILGLNESIEPGTTFIYNASILFHDYLKIIILSFIFYKLANLNHMDN